MAGSGDGEFVIPPCDDPGLKETSSAGKSLIHDCYDKKDSQPIGQISSPPELRSWTERVVDFAWSRGGFTETKAEKDIEQNIKPLETANKTLESKTWNDFLSRRDVFHTEDQARAGYYTLMRGFNLTTRNDGKGELTPEQLRFVNNYGASHTEFSGANNARLERQYEQQKS